MKHLREFNDFEETEGDPKVKGTSMTMSEFEDKFGRIKSYTLGDDGEVIELADLSRQLAAGIGELAPQVQRLLGTVTGWHADEASIQIDWEGPDGVSAQVSSRLLVLADGGKGLHDDQRTAPLTRRPTASLAAARAPEQVAIVCSIRSERGHRGVAWERFTPDGPIALLPHGERHALVWTLPASKAASIARADDERFSAALTEAFGTDLGRFDEPGERQSQPIASRRSGAGGDRVLRIGNAAQTLHPVAGQGLNLGLRDALVLALQAASNPTTDPGSAAFIAHYERSRQVDRQVTLGLTDALARVFRIGSGPGNTLPARVRGLALHLLDRCPPARRFLARRMMLGARAIP
jgi:2-octaprenyl-6-methoxyphenol hydroxylase